MSTPGCISPPKSQHITALSDHAGPPSRLPWTPGTGVYWWLSAYLPGLPFAGKSRSESKIIKGKKTPFCCDTASLSMNSFLIPKDACMWAQMRWEKVTAPYWDAGREAGWAGTGGRTRTQAWIIHRIRNMRNNPWHYDKLQEEKVLSQRSPGVLHRRVSKDKGATGTNTASEHMTQAWLWRQDQTSPTHERWGTQGQVGWNNFRQKHERVHLHLCCAAFP